jgi:hypothetical protein
VSLPERHAPANQQVGDLGCGQHLVAGRGLQALAVELDPLEDPGGHLQGRLDRLDRVEERFLVLLHVLAIGERQGVQHPEQGREITDHAGRLGPQQLGRIGVLLLGHDARPGSERFTQPAERELRAGPDHQLRTDPRKMGQADRAGREIVEHHVPVRRRVERVDRDRVEAERLGDGAAVDLPVDPGQGAGPEWHHRGGLAGGGEPVEVPRKHPEPGEQVMAEIDRLGPLEVGVAGHGPVAVGFGQIQEFTHRGGDPLAGVVGGVHDRHEDVGRDLIVAGTAGVELAGQIADQRSEAAFDRHVDVLVTGFEGELAGLELPGDRGEALVDHRDLVIRDDADPVQGGGVGARLGDVIRREVPVELDRAVEAPETGVGRVAKSRCGFVGRSCHGGDFYPAPSESASAVPTRSTSPSERPAWNGRASERAATDSATGNWPAR